MNCKKPDTIRVFSQKAGVYRNMLPVWKIYSGEEKRTRTGSKKLMALAEVPATLLLWIWS